jgi:hypothetical protein
VEVDRGKKALYGQDDREFQIELTRIKMKYKTKSSTFFGVVVLEFFLFWVIGNFLYVTLNPWLLTITASMVIIGFFTILVFLWDLHDIEKALSALKQKYVWQ